MFTPNDNLNQLRLQYGPNTIFKSKWGENVLK